MTLNLLETSQLICIALVVNGLIKLLLISEDLALTRKGFIAVHESNINNSGKKIKNIRNMSIVKTILFYGYL